MKIIGDIASTLPGKIFLVILGIAVTIALVAMAQFLDEHGKKLLVRFAVGQPLNGVRKTDARFFKKGEKIKHHSGYASKWSHFPDYQRMLIRWTGVFFIVLSILGIRLAPMPTMVGLMLAAFAVLIILSLKARDKALQHTHTKSVHSPTKLAIAPMLGVSTTTADNSLSIRPDYAKTKPGEKVGTLLIPDDYAASPAQKEQIEHLFTSRLGFDLYFKWNMSHAIRTLEIYRQRQPPGMVPFLKVLPKIRELKRDLIGLGYNAKGDLICWDISSEEPMMFVSATTRRGKTSFLMLLAAQILNRGGSIVGIDPKQIGLDEFCAGHPNAKVFADPTNVESMWEGIREFRRELDERIAAYKKDRTLTFPRKTLFIDEVTMFARFSSEYWERTKPPRAKATPPIWNDISAIIFMGAQFSMNACVFGQRVDFRILSGLIDGFGTRLLAGFTPTTYKRLIDIPPIPKSQKPRGRFIYYNNGDEYPQWLQLIYGEIEDMREFALEPVQHLPGVPEKRVAIDGGKDRENAA